MTRGRIVMWILMLACTFANAILVGQSLWATTLRGAGLAQADLGLVMSLLLYGLPALVVLLVCFAYLFFALPKPRALSLLVKQPLGVLWGANVIALGAVIAFTAAVMMYGYFWLR
jgi:hypothetical protein